MFYLFLYLLFFMPYTISATVLLYLSCKVIAGKIIAAIATTTAGK